MSKLLEGKSGNTPQKSTEVPKCYMRYEKDKKILFVDGRFVE